MLIDFGFASFVLSRIQENEKELLHRGKLKEQAFEIGNSPRNRLESHMKVKTNQIEN
jgi:hypothetical protein